MKKSAQKKATARKIAVKKKLAARREKIRSEAKMKKMIAELHNSVMESTTIRNVKQGLGGNDD